MGVIQDMLVFLSEHDLKSGFEVNIDFTLASDL